MVSFEDEWARIKQEVAAGIPTTRLASSGEDTPAGAGTVVSTRQAWRRAAGAVESLAGNTKAVTVTLTDQQGGMPAMKATGIECVGAQRAVYDSWRSYLSRVQDRAEALQGQLASAGGVQHEGDGAVMSVIGGVDSSGDRVIDHDRERATAINDILAGDHDTSQLGGGPDLLET